MVMSLVALSAFRPRIFACIVRWIRPKGVYAVKVRLKSGAFFNGVANIGTRPTINGVNQLLEAHLFDFQGDLYGQWLDVELCHKIRNEMKFPSFDDLKAQIAQDVETAKNVFKTDRTL